MREIYGETNKQKQLNKSLSDSVKARNDARNEPDIAGGGPTTRVEAPRRHVLLECAGGRLLRRGDSGLLAKGERVVGCRHVRRRLSYDR